MPRSPLWLLGLVLSLLHPLGAPGADPARNSSVGDLARWQRQALRQAELDRRSQREVELRQRLSVLLPQLRVSWGRGTQWVYSSRSDLLSEPIPDGDRSNYSISMSWDLSRLLWSTDDLTRHRMAPRLAAERRQILTQVAEVYLRLCQAQRVRLPASQGGTRVVALQIALQSLLGEEFSARSLPHCPELLPDAAALSAIEPGPALRPADPVPAEPGEPASTQPAEP